MQSYQKKNNDLEQQSPNRSVFNSLLSKLTMSKFSSILAICLITFTSFLVIKTLKIQHSCHPMLYSGELPSQCQIASNHSTSRELPTSPLPKQINNKSSLDSSPKKSPQIAQNTSEAKSKQIARNPQSSTSNVSHSTTITTPETQLTPQPNSIATDFQDSNSEISSNNSKEPQTKTNPVTKTIDAIKEHPDDAVGVVAGASTAVAIGVAAGATAVLSIPVAGAVLIGLGVWVTVRSIF